MNLIIGKNGFIAKQLINRNNNYVLTTSNQNDYDCMYLDLDSPEDFDYSLINSSTNIILLAAISSPDFCEKNFDLAKKINLDGTIYFITHALKNYANVLFFSTDLIYGKSSFPVDESSLTNPFGVYALFKDAVEKEFSNSVNFKTLRLSYVLSKYDKFLTYLKSCILNKQTAYVYNSLVRNVVYIEDLLICIENLINNWNSYSASSINVCGLESVSRFDIASEYKKHIDPALDICCEEPAPSFWESRPPKILMESIHFEDILGYKPTSLANTLKKINKL